MSLRKILISGAGIAGLALARQLKKLNIPFLLIEKRMQISTDGAGIALPANAVKALRYVGLGSDIDQRSHQVKKIIYTDSGGVILSEASLLDAPLNADRFVALPRHQFHDILLKDFESTVHLDTTIKQMTPTKQGVLVQFDHPTLKQEEFSAIIGADGINSQVRQFAFGGISLTDLGVSIWRWTCKYATTDLQPTYMLGARDIFMAYPIGKDEVYCYAQVFDPENRYSTSSDHQSALIKLFGQHGGIAKIMLQQLPDNPFIIPGRLRSVPKPLFTSGRVALIGDAGHGCSPMLQQGAACALEDVITLSELLKHFSVEDALSHYEKLRSERVNWIAASSDGPLKTLINVDAQMLSTIQQKIRENGPLNVQGWKKLLTTDPINDVLIYIAKEKNPDTKNMPGLF